MALKWIDRYEVGDNQVDAQHKEWFQIANCFLMAGSEQTLSESGEAFLQYTQHHFSNEESLMQYCQYPAAVAHAKEHEVLVSTLTKILIIGRNALSKVELDDFVNYCLVKHITTHDAELAIYMRRRCNCATCSTATFMNHFPFKTRDAKILS
jgi:hemerythrin-like metal-binding protein